MSDTDITAFIMRSDIPCFYAVIFLYKLKPAHNMLSWLYCVFAMLK